MGREAASPGRDAAERLRFWFVSRTRSSTRPPQLRSAREAVEVLSRPGPHRVLRGDLGMVGIPGVVFAPAEGRQLPAVAFGHDWLQPVDRYADLLRHLASWGVVAAAPNSQRGPLPSTTRFAADLSSTLDVCAGVRLGDGQISVDSRRLALAGHGIGAAAAMIAAASHQRVGAVVTLAAARIWRSALEDARAITAPALHVVAGADTVTPPVGHAEPLAAAAGGPVWYRLLPKAQHTAFLDGRHWSDLLLAAKPDARVRRVTRALVTAFLLRHLVDEERVAILVDGEVKGTELRRFG